MNYASFGSAPQNDNAGLRYMEGTSMDAYLFTQRLDDAATIYRTLLLDLPLISAQHQKEPRRERETMEAAWKAYDAAMRLTAAATDECRHTTLLNSRIIRLVTSFAASNS